MALALLPEIEDVSCFNELKTQCDAIENQALRVKCQGMANYMYTQWIAGNLFTTTDWVVYEQQIRMNNHLEGHHNRLNIRSTSKKLKLMPLVKLLYKEAEYVNTIVTQIDAQV